MVAQPRLAIQAVEDQEPKTPDLKWASVVVREIVEKGYRLDASVYGIDAREARRDLERCRWDIVHLDAFIEEAFYGGRSKRIYIDKNNKNAVGFLGSAECYPYTPSPLNFC